MPDREREAEDRETPPRKRPPWRAPRLVALDILAKTQKLSFLSEGTHFGGS